MLVGKKDVVKVQIKSAYTKTKLCTLSYSVKSYGSSADYKNSKNFDVLAVYLIEAETWYFIPVKKVKTSNIVIFPKPLRKRNQWHEYKDAWDLLDKLLK